MKSFLAILMMTLYTMGLVRPVFPLLTYYVKLDQYKARCVNQDMPSMHCNGKCVLQQQLKASAQGASDPISPVLPKINMQDYPVSIIERPFEVRFRAEAEEAFSLSGFFFLVISDFIADIFHPPSGSVLVSNGI